MRSWIKATEPTLSYKVALQAPGSEGCLGACSRPEEADRRLSTSSGGAEQEAGVLTASVERGEWGGAEGVGADPGQEGRSKESAFQK